MLTRNEITIHGTPSTISEIYSALYPASIDSEIGNFHRLSSDKAYFVGLLFPEEDLSAFEFDWAYIESCQMSEGSVSLSCYSWNGSLIGWTLKAIEKYKVSDPSVSYEFVGEKGIKMRNYGEDIPPAPDMHYITASEVPKKI